MGGANARMVIYAVVLFVFVVLLFVDFLGRADRPGSASAKSALSTRGSRHMPSGSLPRAAARHLPAALLYAATAGHLLWTGLPADSKRQPGALLERRGRAQRSRYHDSARRVPAPPARLQQSVFIRLRRPQRVELVHQPNAVRRLQRDIGCHRVRSEQPVLV